MKIILVLFIQILIFSQNSQAIHDSLFINSGEISYQTLGLNPFPALAFNKTSTFNKSNDFLEYKNKETINLTIFNKDSIVHTIHIGDGVFSTGPIFPDSSSTITIVFNLNGIYKISDSTVEGQILGLNSFIKIWEQTNNKFIWNLNEIESSLNRKLRQGISFNPDSFNPDYFTINGNTHPEISLDSTAKIRGHVGDSIFIFVINSGIMYHSIHFHGYHVKIIASNSNLLDAGREKDSIPIRPGAYQVYLLIPNQSGEYPVHDHNLIATTGGGNYPNGMMVMINILP